jgi:hypothetical protein
VEANTTHTSNDGLVRGGLRGRLAGLVNTRQGAGKAVSKRGDEPKRRLDHYLEDSRARVLHDCRLPGNRGEVSHLIVGPAGVTVVDSRHYSAGRARVGQGALRVGRRNRTDLVKSVIEQAAAVRELLADTPYSEVEVEGAIALREVEGLPTLHSLNGPRIMICGTRRIAGEASRPGPLSKRRVTGLTGYLENATQG